jgi:hypothetical protein
MEYTSFGATRVQVSRLALRRLKTDWIDLYQIHRCPPETRLAETLGALVVRVWHRGRRPAGLPALRGRAERRADGSTRRIR